MFENFFIANNKKFNNSSNNINNNNNSNNGCDLLICDEAHKLKNADSGIAKSLNLLPTKKRILLSGFLKYFSFIFSYYYFNSCKFKCDQLNILTL
jgi:hypothetical protein